MAAEVLSIPPVWLSILPPNPCSLESSSASPAMELDLTMIVARHVSFLVPQPPISIKGRTGRSLLGRSAVTASDAEAATA